MAGTEEPVAIASNGGLLTPTEQETTVSLKGSNISEDTISDESLDNVKSLVKDNRNTVESGRGENAEKPQSEIRKAEESSAKPKVDEKSGNDKPKSKGNGGASSDSELDDEQDTGFTNYVYNRAERLSTDDMYEIYKKKLQFEDTKNPKKANKAPRFIRGFADYVRTLEDRIAKLEENLEEKIEKREAAKDKVSASTVDPSMRIAFYKHIEEQMIDFIDMVTDETWKEKGTFTSDVDQKHFLRVLYDGKAQQEDLAAGETPGGDIDILALQLYSAPVATFLEKLAQHQVQKENLVRMIKPFSLLVQHVGAFKDQLKRLQDQHGASASQPASEKKDPVKQQEEKALEAPETQPSEKVETSPEQQGADSNQQPYDSPEALQHFEELMKFIDKYLGEQVRIYEGLRAGSLTRAAFENLWMLFEEHDTTFCSSQKGGQLLFRYGPNDDDYIAPRRDVAQAYRVLACTGGKPLFGQLTPPKAKDADDIVLKLRKVGLIEQQRQQNTQRAKEKYSPLYIYCHFMDWSGSKFVPLTDAFTIRPYEGETDITSLEVYPIKYRTPKPSRSRVEDLVERGLKFIDYTAVTHLQYDGLSLGYNREEPCHFDLEQASQEDSSVFTRDPDSGFFWSKRVPVTVLEVPVPTRTDVNCHLTSHLSDLPLSHSRMKSDKTIRDLYALLDDYVLDDEPSHADPLKKEMEQHGLLELLPGSVHGFALRDRKWLEFDINLLQKVQEDDDESGWNDLILPESHRAMVQSMVETHSAGTANTTNARTSTKSEIGLVQGKGKGCIILLHGVPGVGKTSTAECVAAYTKRPLFPITCGDIGYEPEEVEENLQKLFKLAHKWGCVLLIDEADVFLAERDKADVKRNGLVSVFLRILEYYSGILFLTTNRVGTFDDAFRSRIHLTLYYPKLDKEQSYRVWEMNIKRVGKMSKQRVKDNLPRIKVHKDRILRFAELNYDTLQWNERQIQNAFQTALALAQFKVRRTPEKRPEITIEHFETIAKASIQFDSYLKEVHLGDEAKNARKKGVRADNLRFDTVRKVQLPPGTKSKRVVVVEKDDSSASESEPSSVDTSEAERKKKKKKAKAKRKAKITAQDGEEADTPLEGKVKKKSSKDGEADSSRPADSSKKLKAKKKARDVESDSDSGSSDD